MGNQTTAHRSSFYELAARSELVPMLREEIGQVVADAGGQITAAAIQKMVKLDSFLKEIMRYYPQSASMQQLSLIKDS